MDVQGFLKSLENSPDYAGQIAYVHTEPGRKARWTGIPDSLSAGVHMFLKAQGIDKLYQHQADAIDVLLEGKDLLLTTGTASGKSLCYQAPILERLLANPCATALLVFPTKALARDQAESWNRGISALKDKRLGRELQALPFDGDSRSGDRRKARDRARVLITNPEMVHVNMLPGHGRWQRFLHGLSFVVLDEVHTYTGFFGANMANVLRRMERICEHYGGRPQIICCSATVGNPLDLAVRLTSRELHVIDDDASESGSRTFVFWNPPRIKKREWRGRRSANVEANELMTRLIQQRVPTICFAKARTTAEMIYRYVRDALRKESPGLVDRVIPYRGGYEPAERREMERRLREGEILGVSATRALELGIDIGMLDACIIVGYPGILNAFFQQAGRAGRAKADSVCFLVGIDTPINQYIMEHPEFIFERPVERVVVDRDNPFVVLGHVRCATAELPVFDDNAEYFGYAAPLALEVLEENRKVLHRNGAWYHAANEEPSYEVRLRGYGDEGTVVVDADTEEIIDRLDKFRALRLFYSGAIYFKYGNTYTFVDHDTERNIVRVRPIEVNYYTDPVTGTAVDHVDAILEQRLMGSAQACLGEVYAVLDTPIYEKVQFYTLDRISQHPTHQPSIAYEAMSFWMTPPESLVNEMIFNGLRAESSMKGVLWCVTRILPLFLTSDANDFDWSLGSKNSSPNAMFWYEYYLHGIGNSEQCYDRFEEILHAALEHLLTCDCEDGCPNCTTRPITPYHVRNIELGEGGLPESRRGAAVLLNCVLNGKSVVESLELVDQPREKRGQAFLPPVLNKPELPEPNRMLINDRTRDLMRRKLERERVPKPDLNHHIDPRPAVGMPAPESEETLDASDSEMRSGGKAIRRAGNNDFNKRLRKRLKSTQGPKFLQKQSKPLPLPPQETVVQSPEPEPTAEPTAPKVIEAGDPIARKARKLRRERRK